MILKKVRIRNFRNILDTESDIEPDITCLVGKNESGKTAFLSALDRLNAKRTGYEFDIQKNYPAWLLKRHQLRGDAIDDFVPIMATFELEAADSSAVTEKFGAKALKSKTITAERNYRNELLLNFESDEKAAVKSVLAKVPLPDSLKKIKSGESFEAVSTEIDGWLGSGNTDTDDIQKVKTAKDRLTSLLQKGSFDEKICEILEERLPGFLYFDKYSTLPYTVEIKRILDKNTQLTESEITARSLLRLGGADESYLQNLNYEVRKRELQNIANTLGDDVLNYWTTNDRLRVDPDITMTPKTVAQGQTVVVNELKLQIFDSRHSLSLQFDEHSSGFQWFFSFLAAFSEYEFSERSIIILLDEPALGLHARAQKDFLRFINERLAQGSRQVIFTTHSPFMVEPGKLHRVRTVEDKGIEEGTQVSKDILSNDPDTLFPLQGALGYDLAQHLFVAEHNLVVEGTSDFAYLSVISDYLIENNREGLDEKWSIVPVGGADSIPTFVALLGNHLEVTVIVDAKKGGNQRLNRMAQDGYLSNKRIITVGSITKNANADIGDLFSVGDYLKLYNCAFGASIKASELTGTDTLVKKIARHIGVDDFNHGKPADAFLRDSDKFLQNFSEHTLDNFQKLFSAVNKTL
jgi:predicted ATPase